MSILASGCVNFVSNIDEPADVDSPFTGLDTALREAEAAGGTLRLIIVHGMGRHGPGYASTLIRRLASRISVVAMGPPSDMPFGKADEPSGNLRTTLFGRPEGTSAVFCTYEVTWSPVVDREKEAALRFDDNPQWVDRRIWLNAELKRSFVNDRFADPVMYVGGYRDRIQRPVLLALKKILESSCDGDRLAGITLSLGSKILFDTLIAAVEDDGIWPFEGQDQRQELCRIVGRHMPIFMLANQLPLLELGTQSPTADSNRASSAVRSATPPLALHLVALNDPNDILTYPIQEEFLQRHRAPGLALSCSNVSVHVEASAVLGIVVNPVNAHSDHDQCLEVLDFIAYGSSGV